MSRQSAAQIQTALTALTKARVDAPEALSDAIEKYDRIREGVAALRDTPSGLGMTVHRALADGKDPAKDPRVQAAANADRLRQNDVESAVMAAADATFEDTIRATVDQVHAAMTERFDAAARSVRDARESLGDVLLSDADGVLKLGAEAATKWNEARIGIATIEHIETAWRLLGTISGVNLDRRYRAFIVSDLGFDDWQAIQSEGRPGGADIWWLAGRGAALSLATFDQYRERVGRVAEGHAKAQSDYQERLAERTRAFFG